MTVILLDTYVVGTPRPKGSLKSYGKGRMVESIEGSPDWRRAVAETSHIAIKETEDGGLRVGYPFDGPVVVNVRLFFKKPVSAPKNREILPSTRATGDSDKHARNIFDALQDAGVIKDDAQIVDHWVSKRYCRQGQVPGAQILVVSAVPDN